MLSSLGSLAECVDRNSSHRCQRQERDHRDRDQTPLPARSCSALSVPLSLGAATHALADLAKQDVPDSVCRAYGVPRLQFGREYLIPKPFDPRVLMWEASAVAEAAMHSGVAQQPVDLYLPRPTGATTG